MRTFILNLIDWLEGDFSSTDWGAFLLPLKVISVSLSVGLIAIIIYLIFLIRKDIKKFFEMAVDSVEDSQPEKVSIEGWQSVLDKLNNGDDASFKLAIIEADKMFDDLLKRIGYQGNDMGERLKQVTPTQLANIDEVWQAHKLRNRLVHEPDFELKEHDARRMIEVYEKALQDLEAI